MGLHFKITLKIDFTIFMDAGQEKMRQTGAGATEKASNFFLLGCLPFTTEEEFHRNAES